MLNITKNLTAAEQKNVGVRKNADGKYELYVKDPSEIDPTKASAGYQQLTDRIGNHDLKISFTLIGKGQSATAQSGQVFTQRALSKAGDAGGVTNYYGNGNLEIFVPEGGAPDGVKGLAASGKEVQIANPDYIIAAHELFGETYKYTPAGTRAGLQNNIVADSDAVIKIENEIRQFHGLPMRSGTDHGYIRDSVIIR